MTIYTDPTVDYDRHPKRVNFERIREGGTLDELEEYVEAFISKGHNPEDPRDEMWAIMGVTPDYFDFVKHELEERGKLGNQAGKKFKVASTAPSAAGPQPGAQAGATAHAQGGRGKRLGNTFSIEDD